MVETTMQSSNQILHHLILMRRTNDSSAIVLARVPSTTTKCLQSLKSTKIGGDRVPGEMVRNPNLMPKDKL